MNSEQSSSFQTGCLSYGISTLFLYFSIFACSASLLFAGVPVSAIHCIAGLAAWMILTWFFLERLRMPSMIRFIAMAATLCVLGLLGYLSSLFADTFYDSQWYHMEAVMRLAAGWDPVRQPMRHDVSADTALFLDHFPKAPWIVKANLFFITGNLELAKCTTAFLMTGLLAFSVWFFKAVTNQPVWLAWLLAILVSINPVTMLSSMSFYVDGEVAVFFTYTCLAALSYFRSQKPLYLSMALAANLLLAHIKLMSSVYAFVIFAIIAAAVLAFRVGRQPRALFYNGIAAVLTFVILGFHPFVTNWAQKGHPLYPAMHSGNLLSGKMEEVYPVNFAGKNRFQRFFISFFATAEWARPPKSAQPKQLFGHTNLWIYSEGVGEMAGWGPMMPEISLLLVPAFLAALVVQRKKRLAWLATAFAAIILLTVFINPEAWLTRYVPQLWLVFCAMIFLMAQQPYFRYAAMLFSAMLMLNGYLMMRTYTESALERSRIQNETINMLVARQDSYEIHPGWTGSFRYRLVKAGIRPEKFMEVLPADSSFTPVRWGMGAAYRLKK